MTKTTATETSRAAIWKDFSDTSYEIPTEAIDGMRGLAERVGQVGAFVIIPRRRAAVAAALIWLVGGIPNVLQALRTM